MKKLIVVADWAADSLSRQEFRSSVGGYVKSGENPDITFVMSTSSTIHTSFLVSQVVETEERLGIPNETVLFMNTDPRLPINNSEINKAGGKILSVKLKSGILVVGPNSGYCFSMIKPKIDELFSYDVSKEINQFRSRDLYTRILAHLMDYMEKELELEEVHTNLIQELVGYYVGHIDNFGNIKTTILKSDFKGKYEYGDDLFIEIGEASQKAKFTDNLFGSSPGEFVIYPGSSGSFNDPYLEISAWSYFSNMANDTSSKTGVNIFPHCLPGDEIKIGN